MMKVGILTGGGDCPGLNAVIRGATTKLVKEGHEVVGLLDGWKGLLEAIERPLTLADVEDMHREGGTMLGTSRTNVFKTEDGPGLAARQFKAMGLDALIAIGGEDTLGVAAKLTKEGLPMVGVPKTIDNDLSETDVTFGFDTAINIITEELDRLHTTARSHHRVLVCEIMGRHAGWMALYGSIAGGAHISMIPEEDLDINELCDSLKRQYERTNYAIVGVSEGAKITGLGEGEEILQTEELDDFGHVRLGGIGKTLAKVIEAKTGFETRHVVLGHLQRGGRPSAMDRVYGTRLGVLAAQMVLDGKFGHMASIRGTEVVPVDIQKAVGKLKTVEPYRYEVAKLFFA